MEKLKPHMLKHCTGALSPTLSQWTSSSGIRVTDPSATAAAAVAASGASPNRRTDDCKDVDVKKEELSRLALFNNSAGLGTSSFVQPESSLVDIASRSSAALHAFSFMSPLGGPYGLVSPNGSPSSFLPPGLQPIYAGSGKKSGEV